MVDEPVTHDATWWVVADPWPNPWYLAISLGQQVAYFTYTEDEG